MDDTRRLFNYRPLVTAALGFAAGIFAFGEIPLILRLPVISAIAVLAVFMVLWRATRPALFAVAILAGLLRAQIASPVLPPEGTYEMTGYIAETPEFKYDCWTLVIRDPEISNEPINGRISLRVYDRSRNYAFEYSDFVSVYARLELPKPKMNTGGIDWRHYYLAKHIAATAKAVHVYEIRTSRQDFYGLCLQARAKLSYYIDMCFPENSGTINGLLLGFTSGMDEANVEAFRVSGISHLLSVSGFHIVVLAGFLSLFLRRFGPLIHLLCLGVFLAFYCAVTAFPASLVRASIMTCVSLFAGVVRRKNDSANSTAISFVLILLIAPFQIYSIGFLLSYSAVAGIILLYRPLKTCFKNLINPLSDSLSLSIGATLGTLPVTSYFFNTIPVYSLLSNIVFIPLASAVIVLAFVALVIAIISLPAAKMPGSLADYMLSALMDAVHKVPLLPFTTVNISAPTLYGCAVFTGGMLCCSKYFLRPPAVKRRCLAAALLLLAAGSLSDRLFAPEAAVNVLYADECAPVNLSAGPYNFILNAGGADGLYSLERMYLHKGIQTIDGAMVLTESDARALCNAEGINIKAAYVIYYDPAIIAKLQANGMDVYEFYPGASLDISPGPTITNDTGIVLHWNDFSMAVTATRADAEIRIADADGSLDFPSSPIMILYGADLKSTGAVYNTASDGQIDIEFRNSGIKIKTQN